MPLILSPRQFQRRSELYHQLAQMTAAGIPLVQAVEMQQRNPPSPSFRPALATALHRLNQGDTISEAFASLGRWLPEFDLALVRAGEISGRLPQVFRLLAGHYEERARLIRTFFGLVAYPAFLLHLAVLIFPVTRLQALVLQGDAVGFAVQKLAVVVPLYLGAVLLAYALQGSRAEGWRSLLETLGRGVPMLGVARRNLALARLSAALEALLSAGVSILEAWRLAAAASGSPALKRVVAQAGPRLESGETPAEMVNASAEFPQAFANLYHTAEVSGKLEESLQRLHRYHQEEGARQMKIFLVGCCAAIIGTVMLAVAWQIVMFWSGYYRDQLKAFEGF